MSLRFVSDGLTQGQSETSGDADALIDTAGLVFEDFTTPGKASRRDLTELPLANSLGKSATLSLLVAR